MDMFEWILDQFATLVFLAVGSAMVVVGSMLVLRWLRMFRFRRVRARIIDLRLKQHWYDDEERASVEMTYEYVADGRSFKRRTEDDGRISKLYVPEKAERVKKQMQLHRDVWVRYDPERPGDAVGEEPSSTAINVGLGFLLFGLVLLIAVAGRLGLVNLDSLIAWLLQLTPEWLR